MAHNLNIPKNYNLFSTPLFLKNYTDSGKLISAISTIHDYHDYDKNNCDYIK